MAEKVISFLKNTLSIPFMILGFMASDLMLRMMTQEVGFYDIHHSAPFLFTLFWSCMLALIFTSFPRRFGQILYGIVSLVFNLYACGQVIYYRIFDTFIWFNDIGLASEGSDYASYVLTLIDKSIITMFLFSFVCSVFAILLYPKRKKGFIELGVRLSVAGCLLLGYAQIPSRLGEVPEVMEWNSWKNPRVVYEQFTNQAFMMQVSGFYEYMAQDFMTTFVEGNMIDESAYADMASYMESLDEVQENSMSGIYKDKNVIIVMMESMDDWIISETYTPTIKMMMDNGINFTQHYAPIFSTGATFNSEFALLTGSYSPNSGSAAYSYATNDFSQSLPNLFKAAGYEVNSFHYNEPTFYNREQMHLAFGFDDYVSLLEETPDWHEAVLDESLASIDSVYEKMTSGDKFMSYVITYSPHLPYSTDNYVCRYAAELKPELWNGGIDEETNCLELQASLTDDFFATLLERLEEDGLLEDTIIIGYADHYSYGYSDSDAMQALSDASGAATVDAVPFFIYGAGIEPMSVDKVNATIDLLPTIANLFGLDVNKYYIGKDIFDDRYTGLAYFNDYSWYDGHTYYVNGDVAYTDGTSDIEKINEIVSNNIRIGEMIVTEDFFSFFEP